VDRDPGALTPCLDAHSLHMIQRTDSPANFTLNITVRLAMHCLARSGAIPRRS